MAFQDYLKPIDSDRIRHTGGLIPGTHLAIPTGLSPGILPTPACPYWHHGVYVGKELNNDPLVTAHLATRAVEWDPAKDDLVIHMLLDGNIVVDALEDFIRHCPNDLNRLSYSDSESPDALSQSFRRAVRALENAREVYNIVSNDSQYFAVYCRTGECVDDVLFRLLFEALDLLGMVNTCLDR